jgi:hypothetical protein
MKMAKDTLAAARAYKPVVDEDKLTRIREVAVEARSLELSIEEQEENLSRAKANLRQLYEGLLPDLMGEAGIDHIGVPARGNRPAFDVKIAIERSANIAASWEPERRQEALDWLEKNGHGDLIKASIRIDFPREKIQEARAAAELIERRFGVEADVTESVHAQTLSAWFREACARNLKLPPFEVIGAKIVRLAKAKVRKET